MSDERPMSEADRRTGGLPKDMACLSQALRPGREMGQGMRETRV